MNEIEIVDVSKNVFGIARDLTARESKPGYPVRMNGMTVRIFE